MRPISSVIFHFVWLRYWNGLAPFRFLTPCPQKETQGQAKSSMVASTIPYSFTQNGKESFILRDVGLIE
jgi:hypothetical protein